MVSIVCLNSDPKNEKTTRIYMYTGKTRCNPPPIG